MAYSDKDSATWEKQLETLSAESLGGETMRLRLIVFLRKILSDLPSWLRVLRRKMTEARASLTGSSSPLSTRPQPSLATIFRSILDYARLSRGLVLLRAAIKLTNLMVLFSIMYPLQE